MMRLSLALLIVVSSAYSADLKRQNFLLAFPEIGYDQHQAVFSNGDWSAVFSGEVGAMFTVPRDSLNIPVSQEGRGCRVIVGNATYLCNPIRGNSIVKQDGYGNTDLSITPPNEQAITAFADAWKKVTVSRADVTEELGPLLADGDKVWFGLLAYYGTREAPIAGLGWYDTRSDQFGRVYSSALKNLLPRWVGVREDTVWVYCVRSGADVGGKLISYSIQDGALTEVDPRAYGMPGDTLLNIAIWKKTLLLATESAVAVWPIGEMPWVWQTDAYASKQGAWLKFLTFDISQGQKMIGEDFFPLHKNQPAQVFARVGDWLELHSPNGIEATMPTSAWKKRKEKFTSDDWGCGEKLCLERVQVTVAGSIKEMDVLDAPLVLLEEGPQTTKVGMRVGWIPYYDVVPVLMKK